MGNQDNKNKIIAVICSALFHAIVIVALFLTKLYSPEPEEGGGILVAYGANYEIVAENSSSYSPPKVTSSADEITQDSDEPSITSEEEEKKRKEAERAEAERKAKEEKERLEREKIDNLVSNVLFASNSSNTSESKGSPNGNSATGATSGNAGYGEYNLGGRGLGTGESLPRPQYDRSNDIGAITIQITVNPAGQVVSAQISPIGSKGSAYNNATLRNRAIASAKKAIFEPIKGKENQTGTITYFFEQQ